MGNCFRKQATTVTPSINVIETRSKRPRQIGSRFWWKKNVVEPDNSTFAYQTADTRFQKPNVPEFCISQTSSTLISMIAPESDEEQDYVITNVYRTSSDASDVPNDTTVPGSCFLLNLRVDDVFHNKVPECIDNDHEKIEEDICEEIEEDIKEDIEEETEQETESNDEGFNKEIDLGKYLIDKSFLRKEVFHSSTDDIDTYEVEEDKAEKEIRGERDKYDNKYKHFAIEFNKYLIDNTRKNKQTQSNAGSLNNTDYKENNQAAMTAIADTEREVIKVEQNITGSDGGYHGYVDVEQAKINMQCLILGKTVKGPRRILTNGTLKQMVKASSPDESHTEIEDKYEHPKTSEKQIYGGVNSLKKAPEPISNDEHDQHVQNDYKVLQEKQEKEKLKELITNIIKRSKSIAEIKSTVSLTITESLDKMNKHSGRSDCFVDVYVRSPDRNGEPKKVTVRVTKKQIQEGQGPSAIKALKGVMDESTSFASLNFEQKHPRKHIHAVPGIAKGEEVSHSFTQRPGPGQTRLSKIPYFLEPQPKSKNAREKLGLEKLQKLGITVQCSEIERIKISEEEFPGVLPPSIRRKWKDKMAQKKNIN